MGFVVVAHRPRDFAALMQAWQSPPAPAQSAGAARGERLFFSAGCAACHRIAGTRANGLAGPDLTHVGSRRTLGAGILPNNRGTMMGWIGDARSEEQTSELQSLMRQSYAVFCLKQKN